MKLGQEDGHKQEQQTAQQPRAVQLPQTEGQGLKVEVAELRERVSKLETTPLPDCVTGPLDELLKRVEGLELTVLDMAAREEKSISQTLEG